MKQTHKIFVATVLTLSSLFGAMVISSYNPNTKLSQAAAASWANLNTITNTFLGGIDKDSVGGVEIAPDKTIVVAGTYPSENFGKTPVILNSGTSGTVLRTSSDGKTILSVSKIGDYISDLDVDRNTGNIGVTTTGSISLLDATASKVLWSKDQPITTNLDENRLAIGIDSTVVSTAKNYVSVYKADGSVLGQFMVNKKEGGNFVVNDIAIDSNSKTVIVTGYTQKDVSGFCEGKLQVAFMRGYDYQGNLKWNDYDWTAQESQASDGCADTRGFRVAIGKDNKLYMAGLSYGGNAIFKKDPQSLAKSANNIIVSNDYKPYTDPYNTKDNAIIYYGSYNPADGKQEKGQFALSRLPSGAGNTIRPNAITADENGNVYIGGISAYAFADRVEYTNYTTTMFMNGQKIGDYSGGDNFVIQASPDFTTRKLSMSWAGVPQGTTKGCQGTTKGITAWKGITAMISTTDNGVACTMMSHNAMQPDFKGGTSDTMFSVWETVAGATTQSSVQNSVASSITSSSASSIKSSAISQSSQAVSSAISSASSIKSSSIAQSSTIASSQNSSSAVASSTISSVSKSQSSVASSNSSNISSKAVSSIQSSTISQSSTANSSSVATSSVAISYPKPMVFVRNYTLNTSNNSYIVDANQPNGKWIEYDCATNVANKTEVIVNGVTLKGVKDQCANIQKLAGSKIAFAFYEILKVTNPTSGIVSNYYYLRYTYQDQTNKFVPWFSPNLTTWQVY
jgi:Beta-propeller repeat